MKILCILSEFPGHIDFGGMGYLRLAESLTKHGHEVIWAAPSEHINNLSAKGFNKFSFKQTPVLQIRPFFSTEIISSHYREFLSRIEVIKYLHKSIAQLNPDVILVDRVLQIGLLISEQLQIPCVSVGTPGGYWTKSESGTQIKDNPIKSYVDVGEQIKEQLDWKESGITSLWCNSKTLNICFLGKAFYGNRKFENSAYIYHFDNSREDLKRNSFGISFGNSGFPERMLSSLQYIIQKRSNFSSIEVFTGTQEHIYHALNNMYGDILNLHGWVKFSDYFSTMRGLAFLGGVGTIWECINHSVPMLVVSGGVGDQTMNGAAVERLGLGQCILVAKSNHDVAEVINKFLETNSYHENINLLKHRSNYTDTMDSIVDKIIRLAIP